MRPSIRAILFDKDGTLVDFQRTWGRRRARRNRGGRRHPARLHAARAAGAVGVAVLTGPVAADKLAPQADVVLPSIAELEVWLEDR